MMPENQSMGQFTPEQGQQAQQQIIAELKQANLPAERLVEIGQWAEAVIQDPSQFPAFQQWLKSQGLPESEIPKDADYQELASMAAIGRTASMMAEQESAQQSAAPQAQPGPISPEQLESMAGQGRMGDTMLAHINPEEAAVLKSMGGVGTINPATGLPEYGFFSDLWKGVKSVAKAIAPIALPAIAIFAPALIPAVGTALGASAALAPVVGAAAIAGGTTLLAGGSIKQALSSAALTGLGTYLSPIVGDYVGKVTGITDATLKSVIGSATFAGGLTAIRGGTVSQILTAAATGAAGNYIGQIASSAVNGVTNARVTQKPFDDAVFLAADAEQLAAQGLGKNQITEILTQTGVSGTVAQTAATNALSGISAADNAAAIANKFGSAKTLYTNNATGAERSIIGGGNVSALENVQQAEDAIFVMKDAQNLRAQGLGWNQIRDTLVSSGVPTLLADAAAGEALRGATLDAGAQTLNYTAERYKLSMFDTTNATRAIGGGEVIKPAEESKITIQEIQPGDSQPSGPVQTVTDTGIAQVDVTGTPVPGTPVQTPVNTTPEQVSGYGNLSEAEFAAADAAQLRNTLGNNAAAIQQNLEYSGVDPVVAADLANQAVMGMTRETMTAYLQQENQPIYTNRPGEFTSSGGGEAPAPTPEPTPDQPLTPAQVGTITGLPPTDTTPLNQPTARDMGTFTPAAPDPSWSIPLQYPGMNPGLVGAGIRPAYQTTSPVQSQYYWGRQPYMATPADLDQYNQSPFMPGQPWGIQQGFFEQPTPYGQSPVYGQGMRPIPPEELPTPGQIGGNEPLLQPIPVPQPVTPYEVQAFAAPAMAQFSSQPTAQTMLPQNVYQYQLAQNPNYVYSVAPTAGQYSVPTAAPVQG